VYHLFANYHPQKSKIAIKNSMGGTFF